MERKLFENASNETNLHRIFFVSRIFKKRNIVFQKTVILLIFHVKNIFFCGLRNNENILIRIKKTNLTVKFYNTYFYYFKFNLFRIF